MLESGGSIAAIGADDAWAIWLDVEVTLAVLQYNVDAHGRL